MVPEKNSLDPRVNPWKRGDLCTRGFEKTGFVLAQTAAYLDVLWMPEEVTERVPKHGGGHCSIIGTKTLGPGLGVIAL
jgi:hypothetical protein